MQLRRVITTGVFDWVIASAAKQSSFPPALGPGLLRRFAPRNDERAFTLIELSIVLVIIGLIIGGVLVGQNLIAAAETRAQITQIEKYNSAVNTFKGKFNYLPGDMRPELVAQYGFTQGTSCNGGLMGFRNGDGLIDGWQSDALKWCQGTGETALFWQDITSPAAGGLVEGQFPAPGASAITCIGSGSATLTSTSMGNYYPAAKIGHGNYIIVFDVSGSNWFGVSAPTSQVAAGAFYANTTIPVIQAYNMDRKIDDGVPTTGNIIAQYINGYSSAALQNAPNTATSGGTSSSCYDTTTGTYSITVNNGNGGNCALSFKFQ